VQHPSAARDLFKRMDSRPHVFLFFDLRTSPPPTAQRTDCEKSMKLQLLVGGRETAQGFACGLADLCSSGRSIEPIF